MVKIVSMRRCSIWIDFNRCHDLEARSMETQRQTAATGEKIENTRPAA